MKAFGRITIDPKMCSGKPCIRGMRFPVSTVLNLVASGTTTEEILRDYPYLEEEGRRSSWRSLKRSGRSTSSPATPGWREKLACPTRLSGHSGRAQRPTAWPRTGRRRCATPGSWCGTTR